MQRRAAADFDGFFQNGIGEELPRLDGMLDFRVVLVDHAAGADVHVADFRIAHLVVG